MSAPQITEAQVLAPKLQHKPYCLALGWLARAACMCCLLESGSVPRLPTAFKLFAGSGAFGGVRCGAGLGCRIATPSAWRSRNRIYVVSCLALSRVGCHVA